MDDLQYCGKELALFAEVRNWKRYWSGTLRRFLAGDVLEAGAGTGSNTEFLSQGSSGRWVCLEPDASLLAQLAETLKATGTRVYETCRGTMASIEASWRFDTILYIDVLEHIEDDAAELRRASAHLRAGGRLVVLSPAHQWLYSPFDASIGHFRRYSKGMLRAISPPGMEIDAMLHLDSAGLLASAANRVLLRQAMPTVAQLRLWDRRIIPVSRILDRLTGHLIGKTVIAVWKKPLVA